MIVYDFKDLAYQFKNQILEAIIKFNDLYPEYALLVNSVTYKSKDTVIQDMKSDVIWGNKIEDLKNKLVTSDAFEIYFSFKFPQMEDHRYDATPMIIPTVWLIDKNYDLCKELKEYADWIIGELAQA